VGQRDLPVARGADHAKAFVRAGWVVARETAGSHIILEKDGVAATLSIPDHAGKTLSRFLLMRQIRLAGLSQQEYLDHFHGRTKSARKRT